MERERLGPWAPGGLADRTDAVPEGLGDGRIRCVGAVDESVAVERGHRLRGWIAAPGDEQTSRGLAVVDSDGQRVGLGLVGGSRPGALSGWSGFVAYLADEPPPRAELVLVGEDGRMPVCSLRVT
jgi:hypothetical protein